MAKESHTARLRLVAAALFAVLWTLTVWTVGHHPARATTSLRVLPAAVSRGVPSTRLVHPILDVRLEDGIDPPATCAGSSGAARVNGAQADPFVSANPPNTACQCRDLHTCLPTTFKMVPAGQSLKHAPALDFIRFKAKYSEVHRNHKATPARDKPLLRVLMSNFGPDAPTCSLTVFIRGGSTDFVALKQIFVQGEHSYLEHIRHRPQVVLDAGANVGFSSLYFSLLFPGARIYALEPDKENYDMLVRCVAHRNAKEREYGILNDQSLAWHMVREGPVYRRRRDSFKGCPLGVGGKGPLTEC
jgi:hypothetical protein